MNYKYKHKPNFKYLGTYKIIPSYIEIDVDCYGILHPKEKQTLEHSGFAKYAELGQVTSEVWVNQSPYETIDISNYLSSDMWDELEHKINNPDK